MKKFTKWLSLLLVVVMCVSMFAACKPEAPTEPNPTNPNPTNPAPTNPDPTDPAPTDPVEPDKLVFTGSPTLEGNAADRLPVAEDVFVSQYDATGAKLEIGTYGGDINVISGGGSWDLSRPTLETIIRRNSDGSYYPNVIKAYEYNDDYTVWTFHLREGMKWSDGDPALSGRGSRPSGRTSG